MFLEKFQKIHEKWKGVNIKMDSKISRNDVQDIVALSPMQEGLLYHYRKDPSSNLYCQHLVLNIKGQIDVDRIKTTWLRVQENNEALRSIFRWKKMKNPVQVILKSMESPLHIIDYSHYSFEEATRKTEEIKKQIFLKPIQITDKPYSITICQMTNSSAVMIFSFHHILLDGWSLGQLFREFINLYENKNNTATFVHKPKIKQATKWLLQKDKKKQKEFWENYLDGVHAQTLLPVTGNSGMERSKHDTYKHTLSYEKTNELMSFVLNNNFTLSSVMLAAWGILSQIYNDTDDVLIGTVVSGRKAPIMGIENLVGVLSNTIPFRISDNGSDTVRQFINRVHESYISIEPFENTPLVDIKSYSGIDNRSALFDALIVIENYPLHDLLNYSTGKSIQIDSFEFKENNHFPLTLTLMMVDGNLVFNATYNAEVFSLPTLERIIKLYEEIIKKIVNQPNNRLELIDWLPETERSQLIVDFNNTELEYSEHDTIPNVLENQARRWPDRIALVCEQQEITYSELDKLVTRIANGLIESGIQPNSIIGIMMPRSINLVAGILGIMRAGCAYMPVDQRLPLDRIQFMCLNANVQHLIVGDNKIHNLNNVITLPINELKKGTTDNVKVLLSSDQLAYLIYTSGSTGKPKGVMVTHKAIMNRLNWSQYKYTLSSDDTLLQKTPISFDVSVWELFWWVFGGAKLCLLSPGKEKDPESIVQQIFKNNITIIHFVPSMLGYFLDYLERNQNEIKKLKSLRRIFSSGESLKASQVERIKKLLTATNGTQVTNMYGPTEAAVEVSYYDINNSESLTTVPIGKPISNVNLHILDRNKKLQPIGAVGELYISGVCLAQGYINQPKLTSEKFVQHPWLENEVIYSTGDKAIRLPDGNIQYLGRNDDQIKIRGYRIELTEIEEALLSFPFVKDAAVMKIEQNESDVLHAFIISSKEVEQGYLRNELLKKLPDYMVPNFFHQVSEFIKTPSGKLDRAAMVKTIRIQPKTSVFHQPKTDTEQKLASIWSEVLKLNDISLHDNFFEVGGHSLSLLQVQMMIHNTFGKELSVSDMFRLPTIQHLGDYIDGIYKESHKKETAIIQEDNHTKDDIAIIGLAGRFPGADNTEQFWENLVEGLESIHFFSDEELLNEGVPEDYINNPNYVKAAGIIKDADYFDAEFFKMSPIEVEMTDPQQRLLLECSWEALENAGYNPLRYEKKIGLFAGTSMSTYLVNHVLPAASSMSLDEYGLMLGNDKDFLTTRVSHKLNLRGPSLTIQTACSSSLVSVHIACQSLINGECTISLAGGVSIEVPQKQGYMYQNEGIRSPDGHCRAFDEGAAGTVKGSGVGIVVLKRLQDAIKDGDYIYSVIKGSSVNNDGGQKLGYTAPGIDGQAEVITDALNRAGVHPESISYVETHGTGTSLGDPVEISALTKAFRTKTDKFSYCALGSVKTNIGHLDAAAGIAGLIKTTLAIKNKKLPPTLHFHSPNPKIDFENTPFYVNNLLRDWKSPLNLPLRAGISSFGIGGTNAHIVMEEYQGDFNDEFNEKVQNLIVFSGKTAESLVQNKQRLANHLRKHPGVNLSDIAYTLQKGRAAFDYRQYIVAKDTTELLNVLEQTNAVINEPLKRKLPITFYLSGQYLEYIGIGRELYKSEKYYRKTVNKCSKILSSLIGIEIEEFLYPNKYRNEISNTAENYINQAILFTIEYSLAKLYIHIGINPNYLIGNHTSEITAACISGVFSLEEALWLVIEQGKINEQVTNVSNYKTTERTNQLNHLQHFKKELYNKINRKIKFKKSNIPFYSNISGNWITNEQATDINYWVQNILLNRNSNSVMHFVESFESIYIKFGDCDNFTNTHNNNLEKIILHAMPSNEEKNDDFYQLFDTIGRLWCLGFEPTWDNLSNGENRRRYPLPSSFFQRKRYLLNDNSQNKTLNVTFNKVSSTSVAEWTRVLNIPKKADFWEIAFIISEQEVGFEESLKYTLEKQGKKVYLLRSEKDINWTEMQKELENIQTPIIVYDLQGLYNEQFQELELRIYIEKILNITNNVHYILVGENYYNATGIDNILSTKVAQVELYLGYLQNPNLKIKIIDVHLVNKSSPYLVNLLIKEAEVIESKKSIVALRGAQQWEKRYKDIKLPEKTPSSSQKVFLIIIPTENSNNEFLNIFSDIFSNITFLPKYFHLNNILQKERIDYKKLILEFIKHYGHIDGVFVSLDGSDLFMNKTLEEQNNLLQILDYELNILNNVIDDLCLGPSLLLVNGEKKYANVLHAYTSSIVNQAIVEEKSKLWTSIYLEGNLQKIDRNQMEEILKDIYTILFDMEKADWVLSFKNDSTTTTINSNKFNTLHSRPKLSSNYIEPKDIVEKFIAQIWGDLLRINKIGLNDHFLELGGNSLYGLQVVSRLREVFQVDYKLEYLFSYPTISDTYRKLQIMWGNKEVLEEIVNLYNEVIHTTK